MDTKYVEIRLWTQKYVEIRLWTQNCVEIRLWTQKYVEIRLFSLFLNLKCIFVYLLLKDILDRSLDG